MCPDCTGTGEESGEPCLRCRERGVVYGDDAKRVMAGRMLTRHRISKKMTLFDAGIALAASDLADAEAGKATLCRIAELIEAIDRVN